MKTYQVIKLNVAFFMVFVFVVHIRHLNERIESLEKATVTIPNVLQPAIFPRNYSTEPHNFVVTNIAVGINLTNK